MIDSTAIAARFDALSPLPVGQPLLDGIRGSGEEEGL
jgi:hypothetical protein